MVHLSDLTGTRPGEEAIQDYKKGDMVKVKVLDVDVEKERISLGIKQLAERSVREGRHRRSRRATVVTVHRRRRPGRRHRGHGRSDGMPGLHPQVGSVARPLRAAPRPLRRRREGRRQDHQDRPRTRRVALSIKAREVDEEKQAMAEFGSSDSGASLGDILGAALSRAQKKDKKDEEEEDK